MRLLDLVKNPAQRLWYAQQTIANGWSRNTLVMQIEGGLFSRQGQAITSFQATLPSPQSDLAQQVLKDPYNFDFLMLSREAHERDLDLLFYHLRLRSFVVIDLKMGPFKPEYAGKMNFYLSAVDDILKHQTDQPSIGLILCKSRNQIVVEYALRDTAKPMGIAEFRHLEALPAGFKGNLPTVEEIEAEFTVSAFTVSTDDADEE